MFLQLGSLREAQQFFTCMSLSLVLNPVCLPFYFFSIYTAMNESGVQWSVATEEDYKNGERLVIKHNKVNDSSKVIYLIRHFVV